MRIYLGSVFAMLLVTILILLLFGNWFLTETLIFMPMNLATRIISFSWWGVALVVVLFFAWCVAED